MNRTSFVAACSAAVAVAAHPHAAAAADDTVYDLETPSGTIFGTVLMPEQSGPVPVVLIIAGSGPTDRNGNSSVLQLNMYLKLARALAALGVATVRYDKRGIAASHAAIRSEADLRFDMFVDDAARWIVKLRSDKRFSRITVAGHSEGSLVGMVAVQRQPADAYVSLEGAGFPAADILRTQMKDRLAPYPDLAITFEKTLVALDDGRTVADVPASLAALFRPSVQPYLISWFKYHPIVEIAKVKGRVMIVQGTNDIQVPVENGLALANAQPHAAYVAPNGLTHVLSDDAGTTLAAQLAGAYADAARPVDIALVRALVMEATAAA